MKTSITVVGILQAQDTKLYEDNKCLSDIFQVIEVFEAERDD
jgi:hypothetical protein